MGVCLLPNLFSYKKKDFETSISHYSKAFELDDGDISFLTNRAAVYLEMGKYDECIKDCEKAVERGRELRSDYKMVARALTRKGPALVKMAKTSKDFEPAIETFQFLSPVSLSPIFIRPAHPHHRRSFSVFWW
ncbi:hypothetical protein L1887_13179 [Cichorium endivia]|nr:hypothetical protein L1887_13179 [Cichorium endivia]